MRDIEKTLRDLHASQAEMLLALIQSGEASAAELKEAREFLKDNKITATLEQSTPLRVLSDKMPYGDPDLEGVG